jgi:protein-tyrosine kinase
MSRLTRAIEMAASIKGMEQPPAAPVGIVEADRKIDVERLLNAEPLPAVSPFLVAHRPNDRAAEAYRKLKSLVVKRTTGPGYNTLMVTSTLGGEGKTITALNLALALAQEYDHTALLVDVDLRKPAVHRYLGFQPECGLIHVLRGEARLEEALVKTGLGKLVVLPAGGAVSDPSELIASGRMLELVRELKTRYADRYVLFDTPPILPFADAHGLSRLMDGVLFVVREGIVRPEHIDEAMKLLADARVLGTVYNDATVFGGNANYHYGYGYGYGAGQGQGNDPV